MPRKEQKNKQAITQRFLFHLSSILSHKNFSINLEIQQA
jgi:hypothetical protein